jgi:hypothetical protein
MVAPTPPVGSSDAPPPPARAAGHDPGETQMKWRQVIVGGLVCAAVAGVILWVLHARLVGHWLQVHTGTVNEGAPITGSGLDSARTSHVSEFRGE